MVRKGPGETARLKILSVGTFVGIAGTGVWKMAII
jgi:hypothetical protein